MDETGWSRRHVTRAQAPARSHTQGLPALLRFQYATTMLMEQTRRRSLADIATEAGFYDQSHLTRDFAALAGMTPAAFAADSKAIPEVRFVQDADEMVPA